MISRKRNLPFALAITFLFQLISYSQTEPDKFIVGTLAASMHPPYDVIIINNDALYDTILSCGFNSIYQKVAKGYPIDNSVNLSKFDYIYAANDSSTIPQDLTFPENGDWINYFTQAKYFRWEAEGDNYFPDVMAIGDSSVGIKHNNVGFEKDGGWSSDTLTSDIGKNFIDGPNYTQYNRYVFQYKPCYQGYKPIITYKVDFSLKLGSQPVQNTAVAKITAYVIDKKNLTETTLKTDTVWSDLLSTLNFITRSLTYDYTQVLDNSQSLNLEYPNPPGIDYYSTSTNVADWIDFDKKIQFRVERLSNIEVIVDYIDVYDAGPNSIWEYWLKDRYLDAVDSIQTYLSDFSSLGNKLKYFTSLDEPHSWDSFIPIKKVQEILDNLTSGKELLVHFYPEWNNFKEGTTVLDKWKAYAEPKKLMFWYSPFTCEVQ